MTVFCQMEDSEGTVRQIGAFSEEINNLTVRRQNCFDQVIQKCSVKDLG